MTDEPNKIIPLATLDDLTAGTINAVLMQEDDSEVRMQLKMLSAFKILEIQHAVPLPPPVVSHPGKNGELIYNWNDAQYLRDRDVVFIRRNLLVLAHMIQQPAIPGNNHEEKASWLADNLKPVLQDQLVRLFRDITSKGEARIQSRAETFQPNGSGTVENLPPDGVDNHAVERLAG